MPGIKFLRRTYSNENDYNLIILMKDTNVGLRNLVIQRTKRPEYRYNFPFWDLNSSQIMTSIVMSIDPLNSILNLQKMGETDL